MLTPIHNALFGLAMAAGILAGAGCGHSPRAYTQTGEASYYADALAGSITASGEIYQPDALTAAHRRLPLGTKVEVVNLSNGKSVAVVINDRGPYAGKDRILDLSKAAAEKLGFVEEGVARVRLTVIEPAPGYTIADSVVAN